MTVTAGAAHAATEPEPPRRRSRLGTHLLVVGIVALAVSPVMIGALSLVGDTWYPAGDWGHFVYRVSQVGTRETPLVGSYTVKGWAHPGPLGFWLAAPLYRLTGGDPRALLWTGAIVNVAVLAALGGVAWRRGRWPLLLAVMALAALLVRGFGPRELVDLWNPYLPLTSFLLTVFLVWDAALGRRRALLEAVIPACLAMQSHLAFVSLVGLLAVWLVAWARWWPRLLPADDTTDAPADDGAIADQADLPRPPWAPWFRTIRRGLVVGVALWLAPLADALFDLHNPWNIARSFSGGAARVGLVQAVGLVGRYVRPDGPWMGGPEPIGSDFFSVQGSGALPLLVAIGAMVACLAVARRRGLVDVVALACLALTLVLGAIPAAAQVPLPNETYLMQWLNVVGGLVWFTAAWTLWRVATTTAAAASTATGRRTLARWRWAGAAVTCGLVAGAAATTWGSASSMRPPLGERGADVNELVAQLGERLPRGQTIRVAHRGEFFHVYGAGVTYRLIDAGYDVVTDDGAVGLKWGHGHRWSRGEPYDLLVTVAVNRAINQCQERSDTEMLASFDGLSPEDRAWLFDVQLRRLDGPDAVTPAEVRRAEELAPDDVRVAVFQSPRPCAADSDSEVTRSSDASIVPVAVGSAGLAAAALVLRVRRRARRAAPAQADASDTDTAAAAAETTTEARA